MVQEMFPDIRIGVGHGQMPEAELEKVMLQFMRHEFDVFVSTTIVENGLDIPLANTMIIENAERYGLSELYQLRGRVGRSNRRAYCYLFVEPDTELTRSRANASRRSRSSATWARDSRSRRSIWNCAAPAICWAANSTATSTPSDSICTSACWKIRCASCAAKRWRRKFIRR
jgi:superfamily II DNA/RNA helicase